MSKNENKLVPKLRFPEFRDAGDWDYEELNKLLYESKQRNKELKYIRDDVLSVSGDFGCVNQIEFLGRSYAGAKLDNYHIVETGEIVYTKSPLKRNPYGIIKENKGQPGIVSTLYAVYHCTKKGYAPFLDYFFSDDYHLNSYLQPLVKKGAKNDIKVNNSEVLRGKIPFPKIDEQQKIADCLSSIDELISLHTQKLNALKDYKKGLMQQLFPAEGEKVPRLRFPEFRDAGEWEEKAFNELCKFVRGPFGGALKKEIFVNEGFAVYEQAHAIYGNFDSFRYYIDNKKFDELKRFSVCPGDIIMSCSGTMGKFSIIPQKHKQGVINQALLKLTINSGNKIAFMKYILELPSNQVKLLSQSAGGAIKNIVGVSQLKVTKFMIPSYIEQVKISRCISSLDTQIDNQASILEKLNDKKKGLIQQLFPSIHESLS